MIEKETKTTEWTVDMGKWGCISFVAFFGGCYLLAIGAVVWAVWS